jgi:hypothetical protein
MQEDGADAEGLLRAPHDARLMSRDQAGPAPPGGPDPLVPRRRALLAMSGLVSLAAAGSGVRRGWAASPDAVQTDEIGDRIQRLPRGRLPAFAADPEVGRLYRFAVDRPDVLQYMPCFCGCGRLGHRDNRHCYVKAEHADGTLTYTSHAAT